MSLPSVSATYCSVKTELGNLRVLRRSSFNVSDGDADVIVVVVAVAVTVDILACSFTCGLTRDTTRERRTEKNVRSGLCVCVCT